MNMKRNYVFLIILLEFLHVTLNCVLFGGVFSFEERLEIKKNIIRILYHHTYSPTYLSFKFDSYFYSCIMADCSYTTILRFFMELFICCVHGNIGFQSIFSDSVLLSTIVHTILPKYDHMLWTSDRDEENKVILLPSHAVGCILIMFVPSNIWMTIGSALIDILWPEVDGKFNLITNLAISSGHIQSKNDLTMPMYIYGF